MSTPKTDLLDALSKLYYLVDDNFDDNQSASLLYQLERAVTETESQWDDLFGTEGARHTIFGKD